MTLKGFINGVNGVNGVSGVNEPCWTLDGSCYNTAYSTYGTCDTTVSSIKDNYVSKDYLDSLFTGEYEWKHNPDGTMTVTSRDIINKEQEMKKSFKFKIVDYRTYENVVVIVTFEDEKGNRTDVKSVCNDGDIFDLERGIEVCVFKYLYGDTYKNTIKEAMRQIKAVDKAKEDKKKEEELVARKKAKAARKKAKRLAQQRQRRIDEMQEAFFGAMVKHDSYMEQYLYEDDMK